MGSLYLNCNFPPNHIEIQKFLLVSRVLHNMLIILINHLTENYFSYKGFSDIVKDIDLPVVLHETDGSIILRNFDLFYDSILFEYFEYLEN